MTLTPGSAGWNVFASSWNPGITMTVSIFYHVAMPIPDDYIVTFQLWISNLTPVLTDSCYFDSTFTVNLNPSALSVINNGYDQTWNIIPGVFNHYLYIDFKKQLNIEATIFLYSTTGSQLYKEKINAGSAEKIVDISILKPGIYFLLFESEDQVRLTRKIFVPGEF